MDQKKREKAKNIFLYGGLTKQEFVSIKPELYQQNLSTWRVISSILAILFLSVALINQLTSPSLGLIYTPDWVMGAFSALAAVLLNTLTRKKPLHLLLWTVIFLSTAGLYATGLILGLTDSANSPMVTFIVFLLAAPMITVDAPCQSSGLVMIAFVTGAILSQFYKIDDAQVYDLYHCILFGIVSIFLHYYIMSGRLKGILAEKKLEESSRTDALTKCKNELAYIEECAIINKAISKKKCKPFAIAMFDVNGVKYVDDTYGHIYGCTLIVEAGRELKTLFSNGSSVFHLGGDEFVVILKGSDFDNRAALCNYFVEKNENSYVQRGEQNLRLSLAYGISDFIEASDADFRTVFQRADTAMYANKKIVKKRQGIQSRKEE